MSDVITTTAVWTTRDWIDALDALDVSGPLPRRLVVLPSPAAALAFRRALIEGRRADLLLGTEITTAAELVSAVGVRQPLDPAVRRVLIRRAAGVELERLDRRRLASGDLVGAVAAAIAELEDADLVAADLDASPSPVVRDVGRLWSAHGGGARRFTEAVEALRDRTRRIDATLAVVDGSESAGEAMVIRALPNLTLAMVCARPDGEEHRERLAALFGRSVAGALDRLPPRPGLGDDVSLLSTYLFDDPVRVASSRPPSAGCDGTARLELYATESDEVDAAVDWVCREILDSGTHLDRIALITASIDPWASRLRSALAALPWGGGVPVAIAGGVPLPATADGARLIGWLGDGDLSGPIAGVLDRAVGGAEIGPEVAARFDVAARELAEHGPIERGDLIELASTLRVEVAPRPPAIFVGTACQARGLDFAAIRFVGFGAAVEPAQLGIDNAGLAANLRTAADRRRAERQAIAALMRAARRVAVSAAGAPGAVMHAAARALGRGPTRGEGDSWAEATPATESMWLRRAAAGRITAPESWRRDDALDPAAIWAMASRPSPARIEVAGDMPGLDPDRPITAARLADLVACPHRFLLESLSPAAPAAGAGPVVALPTIAGPLHVVDGPELPPAIRAALDDIEGAAPADPAQLAAASRQLDAAAALLSDRELPRTPRASDCGGCRFEPACGGAVGAAGVVSRSDAGVALFFELKEPPGDLKV